ncbi:hypothetical protein FQN57_005163 [Myotisia sp. PD_48]|nr:hypothetical protein FQN57_005163 [Myotisia sp. PD_48]
MSPSDVQATPPANAEGISIQHGEELRIDKLSVNQPNSSCCQNDSIDLPDHHDDLPNPIVSMEPSKQDMSIQTAKEINGVVDQSVNTESQDDTYILPASSESVPPQKSQNRNPALQVNTTLAPTPITHIKDVQYHDPTPKTPQAPRSPLGNSEKDLPNVPPNTEQAVGQQKAEEGRKSEDSQSEIQTIMAQFSDETSSLRQEEIMSPRLELADQFRTTHGHFPPRKSSLEAVKQGDGAIDIQQSSWMSRPSSVLSGNSRRSLSPPAVPPKSPPSLTVKHSNDEKQAHHGSSSSSIPHLPEPEADQQFDFHRFLEQLRHRTADPVAKFLRSFLTEFGKRQWMVHEQVKIIGDFLSFITNKMAHCEVWKDVSDVEFDNAKEGMEKLVMNRLYTQTFSPAIPPPTSISRSRSRGRRKDMEKTQGPGRRGQHQEDVERDEILAQKVRIYSWVREEHLDIPPVGANGKRFLALAQQELLKIKGYRAPRDKVICILNCCKVIFGLLRHTNPDHLVSNVQYILRFRNQEKLGGEAGYYLSSLSGAVQFIESLDRTSLTVSDEEFEKSVEEAVSAIAERNRESEGSSSMTEKSADHREGAPRVSFDADQKHRAKESSYSSGGEDNTPVAGLLRTIQKPLSTIGRMFSDDIDYQRERSPFKPLPPQQQHRQLQPSQQSSSSSEYASRQSSEAWRGTERQRGREGLPNLPPPPPPPPPTGQFEAQEAAARQASAEVAEARRIQRAEHNGVVETLAGMFPNLDRDIIDDVVRVKEGRVGLAVDACLLLSAE